MATEHEVQRLTEVVYEVRYAADVKRIAAVMGPASGLARFRAASRQARRDAEALLADLE